MLLQPRTRDSCLFLCPSVAWCEVHLRSNKANIHCSKQTSHHHLLRFAMTILIDDTNESELSTLELDLAGILCHQGLRGQQTGKELAPRTSMRAVVRFTKKEEKRLDIGYFGDRFSNRNTCSTNLLASILS